MKTIRSAAALAAVLMAGACSHQQVPPQHPAAPVAAAPPSSAPARDVSANQKVSHSLAISGDIVRLCGIRATASGSSPKFGFDQADLSNDDHDILQQLATCLLRGALQGKTVELIGRADSRGTEEYNLALGSRRARSVGDYLRSLGVGPSSLAQKTRGALDATGTDEAGRANDRRVDIMLPRS